MAGDLQTMAMRLAFRKEGAFVNCYLASDTTMNDAVLLGSMRVTVCDAQPDVWDDWKTMMRRVLEFHIKSVLGITPEWSGEQRAPEHERAGEA